MRAYVEASQTRHAFIVRRRFGKLVSIEELSRRRTVPELTFLLVSRQTGIEPRCIIGGKEYFELNDFGEAERLLRPANAPLIAGDSLLRPAANTGGVSNQLLRPVDQDGESDDASVL